MLILQAGSTDFRDILLVRLNDEHPRLILNQERIDEINNLARTDTLLSELIQMVRNYADSALEDPVVKYEFDGPDNPRLKAQRRAAMFRVLNCGLTYLLTGDTIYAHRAKLDLLAPPDFPDWASWHFLNVGEISAFMGIGYDWLYNYLTEEERVKIRRGILNHGLSQGILAYDGNHKDDWWVDQMHNINQVCSGGMSLAALAIAESSPDTAALILQGALSSVPNGMKGYLPDGAWREGPTYWAYGTTYNGLLMAALRTSLDTVFQMDQGDGYEALGKSGSYHIHTVGPTNLYFNFGDSKTTLYYSPVLFWLAEEFDEPGYAWFERNIIRNDLPRMRKGGLMNDDTLDRFLAMLVAWYSSHGEDLTNDDFPLDATFSGVDVALGSFHSEWSRDGIYFGFKGGKPRASHSQMDIGSFVMDAKGERWAMDLGYGNNKLPGFSDYSSTRWTYFHNNNYSHNTLVFFGQMQNMDAYIPIGEFISDTNWAYASIDMSETYNNLCEKSVRKYWFPERKRIEITDEITLKVPYIDVRWAMLTTAEIILNGNEALLRQNGKEFKVTALEPENASFKIVSTKTSNPAEEQNEGTALLTLAVYKEDLLPFRFRVDLSPYDTLLSEPSSVEKVSASLNKPRLLENYPNPFRESSIFMFDLPNGQFVRLDIYDLKGQHVSHVLSEYRPAGRNVVHFGEVGLEPGVYVLRLSHPYGNESMRIIKQ